MPLGKSYITCVDNCLIGADTDNTALKLQQEIPDIMMMAAFYLTKWASSSELVMDGIDPAKRASLALVEFDSSDPLKTLGVSWDLAQDCLNSSQIDELGNWCLKG